MSKFYSTYVPPTGDRSADIMLVGEAPGKDESRKREPFVGRSGRLLTRYLKKLGVSRSDVFLTNLCRYQPRGSFRTILGTDKLEEGVNELREEIEQVDPTVVIGLGGFPMYFLTGETGTSGKKGAGITQYRGSVLPNSLVPGGPKVFATLHPAFVLRAWGFHPIFMHDLSRAIEEADYPEIRRPSYESIIDPPEARMIELVEEMRGADWLSVDIETFPDNTISCCGFADREDRGLCITFQRRNHLEYIEALFESPAQKIFQYGTYDMTFMKRFYNIETEGYYFGPDGLGWDTYIAQNTLYPEFDQGLDFLASMYTRFPFYKEERKQWKKDQDLNVLWEYNLKDVIATWIIAAHQMEEMEDRFGIEFDPRIPFNDHFVELEAVA